MLIIILLIALLIYRVKNILNIKERKIVINAILINFFLSICFLILLQLEIFSNGGLLGTIGTDAYQYLSKAINAVNSNLNPLSYILETLNRDYFLESRGYEVLNYLLLLTSPFHTAELIKVFNILLFQNTIVLIYLYIKNSDFFDSKGIKILLYIVAFNGAFIFTSTRIFKDTIYIFLLFEFLVVLNIFIKQKTSVGFIKILLISIISNFFRPYSFIMNLIVLVLMLVLNKMGSSIKSVKRMTTLLLIGIFLSLGIIQYIDPVSDFVQTRYESSLDFSKGEESNSLRNSFNEKTSENIYLRYSLGLVRFVALPSPFRNLLTDVNTNIYWFEGITGKILIFQWSVFYYMCLGSMLLLITKYLKFLYPFYSLFLINVMLVSTYALLYAGASQTRWKLTLVILGIISFCVFLKKANKSEKISVILLTLLILFIELIWAIQWV